MKKVAVYMYEIKATLGFKINYAATGNEATLQNATFLLSTLFNTCPMDRQFGWEPPLDDPSELAKARSSVRIIEVLERNIPEIEVKDITFEQDEEKGILIPRVKVVINRE